MKKNTNTRATIRKMVCMLSLLGYTAASLAQEGKTNQAHVGIIYPLSTNGKAAPADTNNFSLHLIAGVSQQENVCLIAGVSGIVKGNAYGTMVSGVFNHIGNDAKGVQVAGVFNHIKHDAQGAQVAGVANITADGKGIQIAGVVNKASDVKGLQIAGVANKSGDVNGQIAGLINIAKRVKGVQLAGLINIAEESDYPIGILNIIENGEMQLGVTVDEGGSTLLSLRSGGKILYGILGLGYHFESAQARYVVEGGIGAHLIAKPVFRLNGELASAAMTNFEDGVYGKQSLRMLAGFRVAPRIELFAGPTFNHLMFDVDQTDIKAGKYLWEWSGDDMINGFYVGGVVGVQFSL